jgi:hypothetical protein
MWITLWTVTIAAALGFTVVAVAILPKNERATLGR